MDRIIAMCARSRNVVSYANVAELKQHTFIPIKTAQKYLDTPELGDWATRGLWLRYSSKLQEYPWPMMSPHPLNLVDYSTTNKAYITVTGNGYNEAHGVYVEHSKAAKALKLSRRDYDGLIMAGLSSQLGHKTNTQVSVQFNPRIKSPYKRETPSAIIAAAGYNPLLHSLICTRGVKVNNDNIVHTTSMNSVKFSTTYPQITTVDDMLNTASTGIKWWDDNIKLWSKNRYSKLLTLQKAADSDTLMITCKGLIVIHGIHRGVNHKELGEYLAQAILKVSMDSMFSFVGFNLPRGTLPPFRTITRGRR